MEFSMPSITGSKKSDESTWELYDEMNRRLQAYFANKRAGKKKATGGEQKPKDESYKKVEEIKDEQPKDEQPKDDAKLYVNSYQPYELPSDQPPLIYSSEDDDIRYNFEKQKEANLAATNAKLAEEAQAAKKRRNIPQGSKSDPEAPMAELASNEKQPPDAAYKSREEYYKGEEDVRKAMIQSGLDPDKAKGIAERMRGKSATYVQNVIRQAQSYINAGQNPYWVWNSFA